MRIQGGKPPHRSVADNLRDNRRRSDRRALLVAVDHRFVLGRGRAEPKPVDEADLRRWRKLPEDRPHRGQVRAMESVGVDLAGRDRPNGDLGATGHDCAKQFLPSSGRQLLGVVQQRQRPYSVVAQTSVVEQHARDDERACQRAPAGLVGAGDEPRP